MLPVTLSPASTSVRVGMTLSCAALRFSVKEYVIVQYSLAGLNEDLKIRNQNLDCTSSREFSRVCAAFMQHL